MTSLQLWLNQPKIDQRVQHQNGLDLKLRVPRQMPSDRIGADVKGTINAEQMLDTADLRTRVENCQQVYDVLMRKFLFTLKPIWDKKDLRGVTRRFAFFVPNQRRTLCDGQCSAVTRWKGPSRCGSLSTANRTARRSSHGCTRATSAEGAARSLTSHRAGRRWQRHHPGEHDKNMEICGPVEA